MYTKLELYGHVHGRPDEPITSTYSWPLGKSHEEVQKIIAGFRKAFTLLRIKGH